ncbi:sensor histidine kinase [Amphritea balenae]|uniref:histidine kinase n=1 Tax=Amphritea balenae TaxID=452629 RepID=A0A3P1SQY7_9GAMM|nr:sensor histidine kinase [Amphritea balenae]RRC99578.1 sensor histidine kinase [Amphritea balenae]GGK78232.1 sensor histidine kinase [Amphritea balenae]
MKNATPSLERRIRHGLILLMVPAFIVVLFFLHTAMNGIAREYMVARQQDDANNIIAALVQEAGRWTIDESRVSSVYKRVRTGHYYIVRWDSEEIRSRSLWDLKPEVMLLQPGEVQHFEQAGAGDESWLVWQEGIKKGNQNFTLWLAEDISIFNARQNEYGNYLLILLGVLTVLILLLQRHIIRWGFASLNPLQEQIIQGQMSGAVKVTEDIPLEVRPLANAIQKLVEHSGKQISRSRMATGNLAHELKLPLQHLQLLADKEQSGSNRDNLQEIYVQLKRRIDSELRRARISGSPAPGERFNPQEEIPYLVKLVSQGRSDAVKLNMELPDQSIPFDRDDMLELIGNLLDNAWRFAKSCIELSISVDRGDWAISIADDGPGIPESKVSILQQRGVRADEQSDSNYGLGLAICRSVVQSYSGIFELKSSPLGGLQVLIRIPQPGAGCVVKENNNEP